MLNADKFNSSDDDFNPRAAKKEEKDALLGETVTIRQLLEKIQAPWNSSVVADGPSGVLMKERRRFGGWTQDMRPENSIQIVFATLEDFTQIEREMMSNQSNIKLSKQRLTIFSMEHMAFFTSTDEGTFLRLDVAYPRSAIVMSFFTAIDKLLRSALSAQEYERRKEAASKLIPLVDKRLLEEQKRAQEMMNCLMDQGLVANPKPPVKQGYLMLAIDGDFTDFKKLYFTLESDTLHYRHSKKEIKNMSSGERAKASIGLRFARLEVGPSHPQHANLFRLITPYVTYYLRAKHEVALQEWLDALGKVLRKKGPRGSKQDGIEMQEINRPSSATEAPAPAAAAPQKLIDESPLPEHKRYTKPKLEYVDISNKPKTGKIEKAKTTIELGDFVHTLQIRLHDKSISRAHARIDFNKDLCVLVDLGSSLGTQVNGQMIAKKVLQPGDVIVLGKLSVTFRATPK